MVLTIVVGITGLFILALMSVSLLLKVPVLDRNKGRHALELLAF